MGVHDFICHIEQNGQCLYGIKLLPEAMSTAAEIGLYDDTIDMQDNDAVNEVIETIKEQYDGCGAGIALLVLLPRSMSVQEVAALSLTELAQYPTRDDEYNWDNWDFVQYTGYTKFLLAGNPSIWYNDDHWIINFSPMSYQIFVLNKYTPDYIPIAWYLRALDNRSIDYSDCVGLDKETLYHKIIA